MVRNPLFLLTDSAYVPRGAVAKENGRYVGRDTRGLVIFDRKDFYGMRAAAKRFGGCLVSTAWYGIGES